MSSQLSLTALIDGCRETTARFMRREEAQEDFCLELFRRALVERGAAPWRAIFDQYHGLVVAWIRQHPATATLGDEHDYYTNRAFERFWSAVTPERFAAFPGLAALLRYLKLCAHSVLLDAARAQRARSALPGWERAVAPDAATAVVGALVGDDLWQAIEAELHDEAERLVAYGTFALDLKPTELHARYPATFATVADVYRTKRNLLDRLRRSPAIQQFR